MGQRSCRELFSLDGTARSRLCRIPQGERPGENAFDSKVDQRLRARRSPFRNTLMKGWGHGQIGNGAALNLKEQIHAIVENNVFVENDIAFRCRGTLGSAWVTARNNTVYQTSRVFRLEHNVRNVKISGLALGEGIGQVFDNVPGPGEGFEDNGRRAAPPLAAWPRAVACRGPPLGLWSGIIPRLPRR